MGVFKFRATLLRLVRQKFVQVLKRRQQDLAMINLIVAKELLLTDVIKPENLADLLRDKLKMEFLKVIPDESWDAIVEGEWKAYFEDRVWRDSPSEFQKQVKKVFDELVIARLRHTIDSKLSKIDFDDEAKKFMSHIVKETSENILNIIVHRIIRDAGEEIIENLRQHIANIRC